MINSEYAQKKDNKISREFSYKCIIKSICRATWSVTGIYIIWTSIHFFATQLYAKYCTPYSIWGYLMAPFIVSSPHCTGLRWCISKGADTMISMWLVMGTWMATRLGGFDIK